HNWKPGLPYEQVYTGWAYPPKDYSKWGKLVYEWVKHCVKRYGEAQVKTWWWEVWNEPNIGYWKGTPEEYFKLYDYAADAVKRACPGARIGGPTSTGPGWDYAATFLNDFLAHCAIGTNYATGKTGSPLDYISFHAKGSPKSVDGHVQMNMTTQLKDIDKGCAIIAASPFKKLPIIIGECDPEGCAACGMATNPENAYRNGTMYSSYTVSSFARIDEIAKRYDVNIEGAVSWSFEFENQKWFYGFRDLATNGVDKPVLNVFRMYGMMAGDRVKVINDLSLSLDNIMRNGVRGTKTDVGATASADTKSCTVMFWNYHDDDLPGNAAAIQLAIKNIPAKKMKVLLYKIDSSNSNSYELWKKMGSPQDVSSVQYGQLEQAGKLSETIISDKAKASSGKYNFNCSLPLQGVYLLKLEYIE
ncbi:MAG: beta-xylosidase, partial [Bacteroidota bacterium]